MPNIVTLEFDTEESAAYWTYFIKSETGSTCKVTKDFHTPHELYQHRYSLFRMLVFSRDYRYRSWFSLSHHDGTMFEDSFIVGINLPTGKTITYHYPLIWLDKFIGITEYEKSPEWDGTTPEDTVRIMNQYVDLRNGIYNGM